MIGEKKDKETADGKRIKNTKAIIAISVAVIATAAIYGGLMISRQNLHASDTTRPELPPAKLIDLWGPQSTSFDAAKASTGFATESLPSVIPQDVVQKFIRTKVSANGDGYFVVGYAPSSVSATDDSTAQDFMNNGAVAVIYSNEKHGTSYNQTQFMQSLINISLSTRELTTINGHPAVVMTGDMKQNIKSEVYVFLSNDKKIDIVSFKHDVTELVKMAQSIKA